MIGDRVCLDNKPSRTQRSSAFWRLHSYRRPWIINDGGISVPPFSESPSQWTRRPDAPADYRSLGDDYWKRDSCRHAALTDLLWRASLLTGGIRKGRSLATARASPLMSALNGARRRRQGPRSGCGSVANDRRGSQRFNLILYWLMRAGVNWEISPAIVIAVANRNSRRHLLQLRVNGLLWCVLSDERYHRGVPACLALSVFSAAMRYDTAVRPLRADTCWNYIYSGWHVHLL